jgi:hypothetical protein
LLILQKAFSVKDHIVNLCGLWSLYLLRSAIGSTKEATDKTSTHEYGSVSINLYLQTLTCEFPILFKCHGMLPAMCLQPFKDAKTGGSLVDCGLLTAINCVPYFSSDENGGY